MHDVRSFHFRFFSIHGSGRIFSKIHLFCSFTSLYKNQPVYTHCVFPIIITPTPRLQSLYTSLIFHSRSLYNVQSSQNESDGFEAQNERDSFV